MTPLISDASEIPDDLELLWEEGCFYLRVPVAESEDGCWLIAVDVGYRETEGERPCEGVCPLDFAMFGYEITAIDLQDEDSPTVYQTMDPMETRDAIPHDLRALVVEIVCECYQRLVKSCNSDYIYRVTWLEEPSENALKKHLQATETLTQAGYSVLKEGTDQYGCKFWLLGKNGIDHSNLESAEQDEQLGVVES